MSSNQSCLPTRLQYHVPVVHSPARKQFGTNEDSHSSLSSDPNYAKILSPKKSGQPMEYPHPISFVAPTSRLSCNPAYVSKPALNAQVSHHKRDEVFNSGI